MLNNVIIMVIINLLTIIFYGELIQASQCELNESHFESIKVSNLPRASFAKTQFWLAKPSNEVHMTGIIATDKELSPEWALYSTINANSGPVRLYTRASDKALSRDVRFNKKLRRFEEFINNNPNEYYETKEFFQEITRLSQQHYEMCDLKTLAKSIKKANNIIFALGAGVSSSTIPDLNTFMNNLGLKLIPSTDIATEESYINFLDTLISSPPSDRNKFIEGAKEFNKQIYNSDPTIAHYSLARLTLALRNQDKKVYIYSSNVDHLEEKVGLTIDETKDSEDMVRSSMPAREIIEDRNTTVIAIGKSYDHDTDLSKLYTLFNETKSNGTYEFYSINLKNAPIIGFKSTAPEDLLVIPMKLIQDDIQKALPALEKELL